MRPAAQEHISVSLRRISVRLCCRAFSFTALACSQVVECRNILENVAWTCVHVCVCVCVHVCVCACVCVCPWTFAAYAWVRKCAGSGNFSSLCVLAAQRNIWECSLCSTGNTWKSPVLFDLGAYKHIPTRGGTKGLLSLSLSFPFSLQNTFIFALCPSFNSSGSLQVHVSSFLCTVGVIRALSALSSWAEWRWKCVGQKVIPPTHLARLTRGSPPAAPEPEQSTGFWPRTNWFQSSRTRPAKPHSQRLYSCGNNTRKKADLLLDINSWKLWGFILSFLSKPLYADRLFSRLLSPASLCC